MNPTVVAAWIAAGVSVLTLIGTVITQIIGFRSTKADTEQQILAQREQIDKTLKAQSEQLDRTLAEQRTRTLNERFATAAEQLGSDKPAVRLAGIYAMAGLADDWQESRQICVDVLCAYLQLPYDPYPGSDAPEPQRLAFQASRRVRHTVIRVIAAHLQDGVTVSWQGLDFDFTGVVFDGGSFTGSRFSGGTVNFRSAKFSGDTISFYKARFSGGTVSFYDAEFSGGVNFNSAQFSGGTVSFEGAGFSGGMVSFCFAGFSGGTVNFDHAKFSRSRVDFEGARFSGSPVSFWGAHFSSGTVNFSSAKFSGSPVSFNGASFFGSTVDFTRPGDWSTPPKFNWTDTPPAGVKLPSEEEQSKA
jgi:uncharacterized protein YjbI with pentapeptide repeats